MEKLLNTVTQSININAPYIKVFDYLSKPLLYKDWSVNFIKGVFTENNGTVAITPMGQMKFVVEGDKATGNIDLFFGDTPNPIHTRLLKNGMGVTYLFTLFQPEGMPEIAWQQGITGLTEELQLLKTILEK